MKIGEADYIEKKFTHDQLMKEVDAWCQEILDRSPTAIRFLKIALNTPTDWIYGQQRLAGEGLWQYYASDEALEGRNSFLERRSPNFRQFLK